MSNLRASRSSSVGVVVSECVGPRAVKKKKRKKERKRSDIDWGLSFTGQVVLDMGSSSSKSSRSV